MFALFRDGGISMPLLAICSVIALAVVIDRVIYLLRYRVEREPFLDEVGEALDRGGVNAAIDVASRQRGPVARVVRHALLTAASSTPAELHASIDRMKALQTAQVEKHLYLLGTIGATAPFIGLFGTVLGIMRAFAAIAAQQNAGIGVVGKGVSEALIATAVGLGLAIAAVIAYNVLNNQVERVALDMDLAGDEVCSLLEAPRS